MLESNAAFESILNKYKEIKNIYLESLNGTSKILTVLKEDRIEELNKYFDERDGLILAAEKKMKDVGALSLQLARDLKLPGFNYSNIKKHNPSFADAIKVLSDEITKIIIDIKKNDEDINRLINNAMSDVKKKIHGVDVSKMLNQKYKKTNFNSSFYDRNV